MLLAKSCHDLDWLRYILVNPACLYLRLVRSNTSVKTKNLRKPGKPSAAWTALTSRNARIRQRKYI